MEIKEIKNKEIWEGFLKGFENKTFLQSWNWGEFQILMGKKIWRLGVFSNDKLLGVCFVYKEEARRGKHLVIPHGPVIQKNEFQVFQEFVEKIKQIGQKENASFIRVAPILERTEENGKMLDQIGFRQAPMHIHAEVSWQININRSEEEILMDMKKNTRYYARKAEKNSEIKVVKGFTLKDLAVFQELYRATVSRHDFVPFSKRYLNNEVKVFGADNEIMILTGTFKDKSFASAIIIFWQDIAFYHHGASLPCSEPVSYAVQWEIIKEAKARGCRLYNLWGIADVADRSHPWAGLTLFKKGFGGKAVRYVKTMDLPISPLYWFNYGVETIRRVKRGF